MKYFLMPYKMTSKSSRKLARGLEIRRAYPNRRYIGRPNHILINWGLSVTPEVSTNNCGQILNHFTHCNYVSNKKKFFEYAMTNGQFTTVPALFDIEEAKLSATHRSIIYCRTDLRGRSGSGIVVAHTPEEIVPAELYTEGITGDTKEYRIHVFKGNAFYIQQKKKMSSETLAERGITPNLEIKNHKNGFVFAHREMEPINEDAILNAVNAMNEYSLDFGAVDIITRNDGSSFILEINTAPGLEGTTLEKYIETFTNYLETQ